MKIHHVFYALVSALLIFATTSQQACINDNREETQALATIVHGLLVNNTRPYDPETDN